ncbi:MAG: hypothetical protein Q8K82_05170, partial [Gemmatimonadaceae bacterium]|nr:hypothetical protein [Gemmatimonadaceae bacterium]
DGRLRTSHIFRSRLTPGRLVSDPRDLFGQHSGGMPDAKTGAKGVAHKLRVLDALRVARA